MVLLWKTLQYRQTPGPENTPGEQQTKKSMNTPVMKGTIPWGEYCGKQDY